MSLTGVPGSHECLDYHAVHYCAKTFNFSVTNEKLRFLSEGAGPATQSGTGSVTYFVHDSLSHHLQTTITHDYGADWRPGLTRSLLQLKSNLSP